MFTIFSIPKSFKEDTKIIQENAIASWKKIHPEIEIVLFGDEDGIETIADEYGCIHWKNIEKNEYGTPLLNSVFMNIRNISHHKIICYVNCDIILLKDIIPVIQTVENLQEFLLIGRRTNITLNGKIDINDPTWEERIRDIVTRNGQIGRPDAIDCFIFPKNLFINMPPFTVGRGGWDNWLIAHMRKRKIPVIDGSGLISIVHQNHGYHHVPFQRGNNWEGPETDKNRELMGGIANLYTIDDADWILTKEGIKKKGISLSGLYRNTWRRLKTRK